MVELVPSTRAWIDSSAARGTESCNPAQAALRSDFSPAGRRSSSEPTLRLKQRIWDRESSSRGIMVMYFHLTYFTVASAPGSRFQRLAFHEGDRRGQIKLALKMAVAQ